jgi:Tfp pilus assembly protein PilX
MDEAERDYLRQQIQELERSKGRWRLATLTLAAIVVIGLLASGASSLLLTRQRIVMQRALAEREMARHKAEEAARQAEEAARQLQQRQKAEPAKQP